MAISGDQWSAMGEVFEIGGSWFRTPSKSETSVVVRFKVLQPTDMDKLLSFSKPLCCVCVSTLWTIGTWESLGNCQSFTTSNCTQSRHLLYMVVMATSRSWSIATWAPVLLPCLEKINLEYQSCQASKSLTSVSLFGTRWISVFIMVRGYHSYLWWLGCTSSLHC